MRDGHASVVVACAWLLALAPSCVEDNGAVPTCVPGKVESCPCGADEPDGIQVCDDDGTWDDCDCGDDSDSDSDSDSDTEWGACDELMAEVESVIDEVCDEWPDCTLCEPYEQDTDDMPSDEECQEYLDGWDHDEMVDAYGSLCEMEAENQ